MPEPGELAMMITIMFDDDDDAADNRIDQGLFPHQYELAFGAGINELQEIVASTKVY